MKTIKFISGPIRSVAGILLCSLSMWANSQTAESGSVIPLSQPPNFDIVATGTNKLVNGISEIKFDKSILLAPVSNLKVILMPYGTWSGIYLVSIDDNGFKAKSETGDLNAKYNWILLGERKKMSPGIYHEKPQR